MRRILIAIVLPTWLACDHGDTPTRGAESEPTADHSARDAAGPRALELIPQQSLEDCGDAALAMTLTFYDRPTTLASMVREMPPSDERDAERGVNALEIVRHAEAHGLGAKGVKMDGPKAAQDYLERGDILHVDGAHFVVVDTVADDGVHVLDPARGSRVVHAGKVSHEFAGIALLFADTPEAMTARMQRYSR